jgi:hypothetical protein
LMRAIASTIGASAARGTAQVRVDRHARGRNTRLSESPGGTLIAGQLNALHAAVCANRPGPSLGEIPACPPHGLVVWRADRRSGQLGVKDHVQQCTLRR